MKQADLIPPREKPKVTFAFGNVKVGQTLSEVQTLSPDDAINLIDASLFNRQRKIEQRRVDFLAKEILAGRFVPGTPIYFGQLPDGTLLLLNGQHTLWAIVASEKPMELTIIVRGVADEDEAGRLYAVFDIHRVRSFRDSYKAIDGDTPDSIRTRCTAAMNMIMGGFTPRTKYIRPRPEIIAAVEPFEDAIELLRQLLADGATSETRTFMLRVPMLAVVLITLREQPSTAIEFWGRFLKDDGLKKGAPQRALLAYLRNMSFGGGGTERMIVCYAAMLAWNANWDQRELEIIKAGSVMQFHLKGTSMAKGPPPHEEEDGLSERTAALMRSRYGRSNPNRSGGNGHAKS